MQVFSNEICLCILFLYSYFLAFERPQAICSFMKMENTRVQIYEEIREFQ